MTVLDGSSSPSYKDAGEQEWLCEKRHGHARVQRPLIGRTGPRELQLARARGVTEELHPRAVAGGSAAAACALPRVQRGLSGWSRGGTEQPDLAATLSIWAGARHFYRDVLGLAVYREFGSLADPSVVLFLGGGLLEISGPAASPPGRSVQIWLQVRDVHAEQRAASAAGVRVLREPTVEPWGLTEMWIEDPDGVGIVLVEVPGR